jgi:hypothetical protein
MRCLDETTLACFLDRSLDADEAKQIVAHIDVCDECRRLVSALASQLPADQPDPARSGELSSFARAFAPTATSSSVGAEAAPTHAHDPARLPTQRRRRVVWFGFALALAFATVLVFALSR